MTVSSMADIDTLVTASSSSAATIITAITTITNEEMGENEQEQNQVEYISEGQAKITKNDDVFYNNVQEFNRDLSIAVISTWLKYNPVANNSKKTHPVDGPLNKEYTTPIKKSRGARAGTVLEALSATGLRSLRYAKEIPEIGLITANDMDALAVKAIKNNVKLNEIPESKIVITQGDANQIMYQALLSKKFYSIIDLDPFGTASPYIDAAVQAVASGGLLCVTCTDMAVLCGNHSDVCFEKYGGTSVTGTPFCHETALRLILYCIQTSASRYKRCIVPLLSISIDFYCRVFVTIYDSPAQTRFAASNSALAYACIGCKSFETQRLGKVTMNKNGVACKFGAATGPTVPQTCPHCESTYHVAGPLYAGRLHEEVFVKQLLGHLNDKALSEKYKTHSRMLGMITVVSEELLDELFYYEVARIASAAKSSTPPHSTFCSALFNAGYQVSISHALANSVKTNAPPRIVWDVMRAWIKEHPLKHQPAGDTIAGKILSKEPSIGVNFAHNPLSEPPSRKCKLARFEIPLPNSGPKSRPAKAKRKSQNGDTQQHPKKKKPKQKDKDAKIATIINEPQEKAVVLDGNQQSENAEKQAGDGDGKQTDDVNMEVDSV